MQLKRLLPVSAALLAAAFVLPAIDTGAAAKPECIPEQVAQLPLVYEKRSEPETKETENVLPGGKEDKNVEITLLADGESCSISLYDYLVGVVAAEMPASFEPEALKAQSVAARTFTLYKMCHTPPESHGNADICSDAGCCQAYISQEGRRTLWGEKFDEYERKTALAVSETDGQCLIWDNEPIFAAFHSSSGGFTENSACVWTAALPYLVSVYSPETEENVPNFRTETEISFSDFKETVLKKYPSAQMETAPEEWLDNIERSLSGRIVRLTVGGQLLSGTELRMLLSLRSADIEIKVTDHSFLFAVTGYGHGVGMSQYGAQTLAAAGSGYEEILNWYYTDAELCDMQSFLH